MSINRRDLLQAGLTTAALAASSRFFIAESRAQRGGGEYEGVFHRLGEFAEQYMRDMNSPGMTLVLADRDGVQRVATYGFGDLERQRALNPDELFQIGSISKSFVAICLQRWIPGYSSTGCPSNCCVRATYCRRARSSDSLADATGVIFCCIQKCYRCQKLRRGGRNGPNAQRGG